MIIQTIRMKSVTAEGMGTLSVFEAEHDVPFAIKRIYYIHNVPAGVQRGGHAHKKLRQVLWCPYGKILIKLDDGFEKAEVLLDSPDKGLIVESNMWRDMLWQQENPSSASRQIPSMMRTITSAITRCSCVMWAQRTPQRSKAMDWAGIDEWIYRRLTELVDVLPMRFVKLVAHNYTDARVRKLYWRRLGLEMGEGTYANLGLTLLSDDYTPRVHIGNHVSIAANVTFVPMASANNGQEINTYPYVRDHLTKAADIVVEDEVWIGADVTILPGVHIGRCAVIGAGSVVTGDVEASHIYAGVPARKIRDIRTGERVQ